jgi:nifR3 family TIM-barrel protein
MHGFWEQLKNRKPFFVLAPMADVTDISFRLSVVKYSRKGEQGGGPDVLWTEFVSADGLILGGKESLIKDLQFDESERPIVAQLFGSNPETMRKAAKLVAELDFDGIDINMGCPDKSIERQGAGAAMMKNPPNAVEIIRAVKTGIHDAGKMIPVSVKTRVGYNTLEIETWIPLLLKQNISALTVHARTRKELSKVPARWELLKSVVKHRDIIAPDTLIIGNGDITDIALGKRRARESGVDGVMIGRSALGNPWIFDEGSVIKETLLSIPRFISSILPSVWVKKLKGDRKYTVVNKSREERIEALLYHAELFDKYLKDHKNFSVLKKHIKAYINGFKGAKEMRVEIFDTVNSYQELKQYFEKGK